jgi:gamma-glutamyl-gamma-aminobutyrate hydrolase PuuD
MSINPHLTSGGSYSASAVSATSSEGAASNPEGIIDPKVKSATEPVFDEMHGKGVGMIQHMAHGHTFGNYLKATYEGIAGKSGGSADGAEVEALAGPPGLVKKYDYQPSSIDLAALRAEVDLILEREKDKEGPPLAQRLVQAASEKDEETVRFPQLQHMKAIADQIVAENNGFLLPGGDSIHPKFYGQVPSTDDHNDYNASVPRSVMEFCIINACETQGKPLMGICRGHQAIGIYHGAVLDRDTVAEHQEGKVRSVKAKPDKALSAAIPSEVYFNHHQVVTRVGNDFESIVDLQVGEDLRRQYEELDSEEKMMIEAMGLEGVATEELSGMEREMIQSLHDSIAARKAKLSEALEFLASERAVLGMESRFGVPIIGLQFHPEAVQVAALSTETGEGGGPVLDKAGNEKVIETFVKMTKVAEAKRALLDQIRARGE